MALYNVTGILGQIILAGSTNLTGSETLTVFIILLAPILLALVLRIPLVVSMSLATPLVIVLMAYNTAFMLMGGIFLFMLAGVLVKMWFLN